MLDVSSGRPGVAALTRTSQQVAGLMACVALQLACGSRGAPLPPVYPNPPAIAGLTAAQRGTFAILRFPIPPAAATVGAEVLEVEAVEVMIYAERYPVLTADMMVAGLERRAELMLVDAVAADRDARAAAAAAAEAAEAAAADPTADPTAPPRVPPATSTRPSRTPDEELLRRVPRDLLQTWRAAGLSADGLVETAARFNGAVDTLWSRLRLPGMMLDLQQSIRLPDRGTIAVASEEVLRPAVFERALAVGVFLGRATVSRSIPYQQLKDLLVGDMVQVAVPLGVPAPGDLRTRYFFAVRARSERQKPGDVNAVMSLAPAPVPVAPGEALATVSSEGVMLTWDAPSGDLSLRRVDPGVLLYNVYRSLSGEVMLPDPLNPTPLVERTFTDRSMLWGETYVYEVRAFVPLGGALQRESEGTFSAEVTLIDTFPPAPPTALRIARAGTQVTLQWSPSASIDLLGYRVYRHAVPAPPVPARFNPTADPTATDQPPAAGRRIDEEGANPMIAAGWELVSEDLVQFGRYTDRNPEPGVRYAYAVEAVDRENNLSALLVGEESGNVDR